MDSSAQWTQELGVAKSMASGAMSACTRAAGMERKARPQKEQALNCPRCHSTNTKFCYYNNYSLTQPRYFCKTCRRYWTEGGTLRNVPVGGGSRKNKIKSSSASSSTATSPPPPNYSLSMITPPALQSHKLPDLNPPTIHPHQFSSHNPKNIHDLNLGFQDYNHHHHHHHHHPGVNPQFIEFPKINESRDVIMSSSSSSANSSSSSTPLSSALNFLSNGIAARSGLNSFSPMAPLSNSLHETNGAIFASSNFPFQECKPSSLSFPLVHSNVPHQDSHVNGSLMFTLGATKRNSSSRNEEAEHDQHKGQENSNGFWNGMLGGGSW